MQASDVTHPYLKVTQPLLFYIAIVDAKEADECSFVQLNGEPGVLVMQV